MGFAETSPESFLSHEDHKERMRYQAVHMQMKKYLNSRYESRKKSSVEPREEERDKQQIRLELQGPFSPLEHKVLCAYRNGMAKLANIEMDSVNSVLLDQTPSDRHDQWMVAAHVGLSPAGENLVLRNTNWLPARPGLGAIACMMFSPQVEMRMNKEKSRLIGFIAGMGPKTIWNKPVDLITHIERTEALYPEHDLEVKFDVQITNEDINMINQIRREVNKMMEKTKDNILTMTQPRSLDNAQKAIRKNLLELMSKERRYEEKEPSPVGHDYRWNMAKQKHRLNSIITGHENMVYKMIDGLNMQTENTLQAKRMMKFYNMSDQQDVSFLPESVFCPMCPGLTQLDTPRDIWYHIHKNEEHKKQEKKEEDREKK